MPLNTYDALAHKNKMLFIILLINIPTLTAHTSTVQLGNKRAAFPGRTKDGTVINFVSTAELKLLDRVRPILSFTVNLKALCLL